MKQKLTVDLEKDLKLPANVWKFGNDIDTDAIIPGKYLTINKPDELAKHAFEGVRPEFAGGVKEGESLLQASTSDAAHPANMRPWH
jgi:3-isopropylmalate dehydratase small subunit